jgi:predicted acylesterase/phospholipase RssA
MGSPWAALAARARPASIPAGGWLFRQGDPAGSLHVIVAGRLEVVAEHPEPTVIRVLGRGEAVGELALLTGSARSASVRAKRDTTTLEVRREEFEALLDEDPAFAVSLARVLGRQLQGNQAGPPPRDSLPATIAVVGAGVDAVAGPLADELGRLRRVAVLDGREGPPDGYAAALDRAERAHDQVLLVGAGDGAWTEFAMRSADRLLVVAGDGPPGADPRLQGCDLVWTGRGSPRAWVEALSPRAVHVLGPGGVARLARRLAGRSVGAVLSGGGARGLAHIGVLEELAEAGVEIDRFAGCSMGAYVAAQAALGRTPEEIRACCHEEFVVRNPLNEYTVPLVSLLRGRKARAMVDRSVGDARIEELPHDFFCVSCDLVTSELVVHRRGGLADALSATMCLPAIFAPIRIGERLLVDGGVLNNLPVETMAATGEGPVIAVDVTARWEPPQAPAQPPGSRRDRAARRARAAVVGSNAALPSLKETLLRTLVLGSIDTAEAAGRHADLVISPDTGPLGLTAWNELERMREAGRRAAREALERREHVL